MKRNFKVLLIAMVVIILAAGAYAFAAGNTVEKSAAGYTAKTVSGYTISKIAYVLDTDPTIVHSITFTIAPTTDGDPDAKTVKLQTATGGDWTNCVVTTDTSTTVACTLPAATSVSSITAMNIVATSN